MEKYYTPDISDITVGYECEVWEEYWKIDSKGDKWEKWIFNSQDISYAGEGATVVGKVYPHHPELNPRRIRTPYLTKEQIEAEGWVLKEVAYFSKKRYFFEKEGLNYGVILDLREPEFPVVEIWIRDPSKIEYYDSPEFIRNVLPCPSINEFRFIIKLLNIKP